MVRLMKPAQVKLMSRARRVDQAFDLVRYLGFSVVVRMCCRPLASPAQVKELSGKYHLSPNSHVYANLARASDLVVASFFDVGSSLSPGPGMLLQQAAAEGHQDSGRDDGAQGANMVSSYSTSQLWTSTSMISPLDKAACRLNTLATSISCHTSHPARQLVMSEMQQPEEVA